MQWFRTIKGVHGRSLSRDAMGASVSSKCGGERFQDAMITDECFAINIYT